MARSFGNVMRTYRERGGYSRRELAEASGLAEGTVRDYELGKRSPSFEAVCRLALALGVKVQVFVGVMDLTGAFRLPSRPPRFSILTFGRYKGQRLNEVPADDLEWLIRDRPRLLQTGQVGTGRRPSFPCPSGGSAVVPAGSPRRRGRSW
jgi:transcriptional regulator with XRE-family HTH domain